MSKIEILELKISSIAIIPEYPSLNNKQSKFLF
jgi:hypothetical protein